MCVGLRPLVEEPGTAFFRKRRVPQIISQKGESSLKGKYIAKRILIAIPTFFGITLLAYLIMSMAPGSPLDALLADPRITPEELERRRQQLGLDQPAIIQYFTWLKSFLMGDLGYSYSSHRPVMTMITERLGITALLAGSAMVVGLIIALPLGIFAASKPNSLRDYISGGLSFVMVATPSFFMGLLLIYIFAVNLGWLPSGGIFDSTGVKTNAMLLRHLILPCAVLAFQNIGSWVRYMRSSMVEVMQEDYILTARAKGLHKWAVYLKHGLKNSLIPVVTVVGMSVPSLVGGTVVTEQVFNWPGIGMLMVQAINSRDYPVIMGITVIIAIAVLVVNLITDLIYGLLDPRISYR